MGRNPSEEVKIDRFLLEEECETHAEKYDHWTKRYVEAVSERDMCKRQLERKKSELSMEVRKNPTLMGDKVKVTEGAISDYVTTRSDYVELEEAYYDAKALADRLKGVVEAFNQRRDNLGDLVKLWIKNYYYSDVPVPKEAKEVIDEKTVEKHREFLNKRLQKRGGNDNE